MKFYFFALRDRVSGVLTGLSTRLDISPDIVQFYLKFFVDVPFNDLVFKPWDYDVVCLGYYDLESRSFVTEDKVISSLTKNMFVHEDDESEVSKDV